MVVKHHEFKSPQTVNFKMIKMANFMLSEFYLHQGKKKRERESAQNKRVQPWSKGSISHLLSTECWLHPGIAARCPGPGPGPAVRMVSLQHWREAGEESGVQDWWGCSDAMGTQAPRTHRAPSPATALGSPGPVWLTSLILGYVLETPSRECPLKCVGPYPKAQLLLLFIC